jgi:hypothetical protein
MKPKTLPGSDPLAQSMLQEAAAGQNVRAIARQLGIGELRVTRVLDYHGVTRQRRIASARPLIDDVRPHVVIGPAKLQNPDVLAARVVLAVEDLGAVTLICSRKGVLAAALPGTRVARAAAREGAVICTYVPGIQTADIAEDLREVCHA